MYCVLFGLFLLDYLAQANNMNYQLTTPTEVTMLDEKECKEISKLPCKYHPEISQMYNNINTSLLYAVFAFQQKRQCRSIRQEIQRLEVSLLEEQRQNGIPDDVQSLPPLREVVQSLPPQIQNGIPDDVQSLPSRPSATPNIAQSQLFPAKIPLNMMLSTSHQSLRHILGVQSLPIRPLSMPPTMQQQIHRQVQQ